MSNDISPIDTARNITPRWLFRIWEFDALEIHPCAIIGHDSAGRGLVETCELPDADFSTVYGHYRTGGIDAFEDFTTEAAAQEFHDRLIDLYPHLAEREG